MDIGPMRMAGILAKTCGPGGEEAGEEGFGEESPGELALEEIGTLLRDKKYNEAIKAIEKLKNGA